MNMGGHMELTAFDNYERLSAAAADYFVALMEEAVRGRGCFRVALSGGKTPAVMYGLLAGRNTPGWKNTHVFFADERFVPHKDAASNFALVRGALGKLVPSGNFQPVDTALPSPEAAAFEYHSRLAVMFGGSLAARPWEDGPLFDLVVLGLGADGHTASLFPGSDALPESERAAVAADAPEGVTPSARITLSPPALRAARRTLFLVSGPEKHGALRSFLAGKGECPALSAIGGGGAAVYADLGAING